MTQAEHKFRLLLVEDEPTFREPLEHLLKQRSYAVIAVDAVDSALAALQSRRPDAANLGEP